MASTVFFSWQDDTPTNIGRNFIKDVLDVVRKQLAADFSLDEAFRDVEIDSDTKDVPGHPPIVEAILKKIDATDVFVADLTFVGQRLDKRPTPNPNVLIEYGYALKSRSHERTVLIMNEAYGEASRATLPFDLGHMRFPIRYNLPENPSAEDKAAQKKQLTSDLTVAIRAILASIPPAPVEKPPTFPAAVAKDGLARFRESGKPLGVNEDMARRFQGLPAQEVFLSSGPALWLRVMPDIDPKKSWTIRELDEHALRTNQLNLAPIYDGYPGSSKLRAQDGFGIFPASPDGATPSIAFAFRTGEIWSIDTAILADPNTVPFVEGNLTQRLRDYSTFLTEIGIEPPYRWMCGMEGIANRHLYFPLQPGYISIDRKGPLCLADNIIKEGTFNPDEDDPRAALRPFFEAVFEECNMQRPAYLDQVNV